ncbi:unnamed protein product (macronuclear) [Paramecium tetraurelia]|uniref:Transmembrane protein n=1 Tax=Paramecium tetraurelia TaxID=5888 RepID=A0DY29_PARTE|nr:uncharacterized protein GSPATT00021572001 [Paramecium tetraurelia]CAK87946.1 unnamed protein product [Paramecium tetraurelia]|eukprot:XP_001455343.1 hypothetical protein (macronuclear) [Paramecium tetraurelia strain d4-2]
MVDNVFRLKSNVQIPRNSDNQNQLGKLSNDFYCYNYKINRIDKQGSITTDTFDHIQRCFTPVKYVIEILAVVMKYQNNNSRNCIAKNQIQPNTKQWRIQICLILKFQLKTMQLVTQQQFMNDLYFIAIGINSEMRGHYALETGFLPIPLYFLGYNSSRQYLINIFTLTICKFAIIMVNNFLLRLRFTTITVTRRQKSVIMNINFLNGISTKRGYQTKGHMKITKTI